MSRSKKGRFLFAIVALALGGCIVAPPPQVTCPAPFPPQATRLACFTPGQDCEGLIITEIGSARQSILVQAYELTSAPIAAALEAAQRRGVHVAILLDKSELTRRGAKALDLLYSGIPVRVDYQPAIAHNKVMVIDEGLPDATILTGSFNYTRSAEARNAENLLVIRADQDLAKAYGDNWRSRWQASAD